MKAVRVPDMTPMEALFAIANMPRNGYLFLRFGKWVKGKRIQTKHIMCWYHFVCFMFRYNNRLGVRQRHWDGDTDMHALLEVVDSELKVGTFTLRRVGEYDGRYRSECYYCNSMGKRTRGAEFCGPKPFTNGRDYGRTP